MITGPRTKKRPYRHPHDKKLVVGEGSDMQFNPKVWEQWNSDACDRDDWKHGRVSDRYRQNYDKIKWRN